MSKQAYGVLFLCTGNSARSILAEALLNKAGDGRFKAVSAGSFPKGAVHPMALQILGELGLPSKGYRSKSWDEFARPDASKIDVIITVCDNAAGETCPIWPGRPITAHWGIPDPAAAEGPGQHDAFVRAADQLQRRIESFIALPLAELARQELAAALSEIGTIDDEEPAIG